MNCKLALFVLVACVASTLAVRPQDNPRIAPFLHEIDGNKYYFEPHAKAGFFNAFMFCRKHNMELITIETNKIFETVLEIAEKSMEFGKGKSIWTSGTDKAESKNWMFLSNGNPVTINRWLPRQPDNLGLNEHCIAIRNEGGAFGFNDAKCWNEFNFMCKVVDQCN
ncbi:PREDICTED: C-type lectin 37Da-like [Nicrophorus vespilloides]|uniref:C-type lectin 37Da-like n=1 Tax=Nicrophorus vespilloides TaxID=110193 RepID=A0ABM1MFC0_NICVS|nr:PREDICTED: C-type lectin 37Da-like [Nicrophorus vespilloides]